MRKVVVHWRESNKVSVKSNWSAPILAKTNDRTFTQLQTLKNDLGLPDLSSKLNNQLNTMTSLSSKLDKQDESIKQNVRSIETAQAERTSLSSNLDTMIQKLNLEDIMVREFQGKRYVHAAKQANFTEAEVINCSDYKAGKNTIFINF